jgi:hypothetical protein
MEIRYNRDDDTGLPHIYAHGVSEHEVETILESPLETRRGDGNSRITIGKTLGGRYLKVIYVPDEDRQGLFVVTAYELRRKPMAAFRWRFRKKHRP